MPSPSPSPSSSYREKDDANGINNGNNNNKNGNSINMLWANNYALKTTADIMGNAESVQKLRICEFRKKKPGGTRGGGIQPFFVHVPRAVHVVSSTPPENEYGNKGTSSDMGEEKIRLELITPAHPLSWGSLPHHL